jgi:hypothetical protein
MKIPKKIINKIFKKEDQILNEAFELEDKILNICKVLRDGEEVQETKTVVNKNSSLLNLSVKDLILYGQLVLEIIDENKDKIKNIYYKIENRSCLPKNLKKWLDSDWTN